MKEDAIDDLSEIFIRLHEEGDMDDFFAFARKEAKNEENTDELLGFLDELEDLFKKTEKELLPWDKIHDIIAEVTNCPNILFQGDSCIIIENEPWNNDDMLHYLQNDKAKINIELMNKALEHLHCKLEFIEAVNIDEEFHGFKNFLRFRVVKI